MYRYSLLDQFPLLSVQYTSYGTGTHSTVQYFTVKMIEVLATTQPRTNRVRDWKRTEATVRDLIYSDI